MKNKKKNDLIWVYPLNNSKIEYGKTFIYGYSNTKAKLYLNNKKIKIFSNGNFAHQIKLPQKKNILSLTQTLNNKTKIIRRIVHVEKKSKSTKEKYQKITPHEIKNNKIIVIDPGHGGKEHGTHSPSGIPEKRYNLEISNLLFKSLSRIPSLKVFLTRRKDKFLSLDDRVSFAKKNNCSLFISIHHNALPDNLDPLKHKGIGIYYTHDALKPLANSFLRNISHEAKLNKYGVFKRNFRVIKQDFYSGILIECGFLIHPVESEIIIKKSMQKKIVKGIKKTILSIFFN